MAKKRNSSASLTSRLMNGTAQENREEQRNATDFHTKPGSADPKDYELSEEQIDVLRLSPELAEALNKKRTENVGRPRKEARKAQEEGLRYGDTRATFILKKDLVQKLKYISLMETRTIKALMADVLGAFVEKWERENGVINFKQTDL